MHYSRVSRYGDPTIVKIVRGLPPKKCSIAGCIKIATARGWCDTHYTRWKIYRNPMMKLRTWEKRHPICTVQGCIEPNRNLGLCNRHYHMKFKREVFAEYGGKCECCGENRIEFLCIDHKNGDGKQDRLDNKIGGGVKIYFWLRKHNYPKEKYRVLCQNCNASYGAYGYCPHHRA